MAELKGKIDQFTLTVGDFNVESGQEEPQIALELF